MRILVAEDETIIRLDLRELLEQKLDHLEMLYERGESITGVPTGYTDLDERLGDQQAVERIAVQSRQTPGRAS